MRHLVDDLIQYYDVRSDGLAEPAQMTFGLLPAKVCAGGNDLPQPADVLVDQIGHLTRRLSRQWKIGIIQLVDEF
jgi:hypothetical protein